jgi:hypothetical protein
MAVLTALLLGACAESTTRVQSPASEVGPQVVRGNKVPSGTNVLAALDQPIGQDTKPGQVFTAHTVQAVVDSQGAPIIPENSQITGRVADVKSGSSDRPAEVDLVIEKIAANGVDLPVDARIVATDVEAPKHGVKGSHVAIGAGGGGILGGIIGGWQGAVIGGLAGAATGTAVSLGLAQREAKLPVGTVLTVQLTRSIPVAALRGGRAG